MLRFIITLDNGRKYTSTKIEIDDSTLVLDNDNIALAHIDMVDIVNHNGVSIANLPILKNADNEIIMDKYLNPALIP